MNKLTGPLLDAAQANRIDHPVAPSLERRRLRAYVMMMLADAIVLHLAFAGAGLVYEGVWWYARNMLAVQVLLPVYFTIALYNETYGGKSLDSWTFASKRALTALLISVALLNFLAFYTKSNADFSRVSVTLGLAASAVAIVLLRRFAALVVEKFWGGRTRNLLVIDDGGSHFTLEDAVHITAKDHSLDPTSHDPFMLDRLGKLLQNQDKVVISTPKERREYWAFLLKSAGVYGEIVSEPANPGAHMILAQAKGSGLLLPGDAQCLRELDRRECIRSGNKDAWQAREAGWRSAWKALFPAITIEPHKDAEEPILCGEGISGDCGCQVQGAEIEGGQDNDGEAEDTAQTTERLDDIEQTPLLHISCFR